MKSQLSPKSFLLLVILCALFFAFGNSVLFAQETTPSPTATPENEELKKLREEIERLKLESEKATLEKTINDTQYPKPTTTPLAGTTTVDANVKIETEMQTYKALSKSANDVAKDIKGKVKNIKNIAVLNPQMIKTLQGYSATLNQLDLMLKEYKRLMVIIEPPEEDLIEISAKTNLKNFSAPLAIGQSVLGAFVDLISLFRSNTTVTGNTFTIQESAFVSEIFRSLNDTNCSNNKDCIKLFYPAEFAPKPNGLDKYHILAKIDELYYLRSRAEEIVTGITELEKAQKETKAKIETLTNRLKQISTEMQTAISELDALEITYRSHPNSVATRKLIELKKKQIESFDKEVIENPKQTAKAKEALLEIEKSLVELYGQIRLGFSEERIGLTFINIAKKYQNSFQKFLKKDLTSKEIIDLLDESDNPKKKELLKLAKDNNDGKDLTESQKKELFEPVSAQARKMFQKLQYVQNYNIEFIINGNFYAVFSDDELLLLLYPNESERKFQKEVLLKNRQIIISRLKALNAQFNKFYEDMIKVDTATGVNPITLYLQGENLRRTLGCNSSNDCPHSYILSVKVISASGNNKVSTNLIRDVFAGPNIKHSGGVIVEYRLYDTDGMVNASSIFTVYEDYKKAKSINEKKE